MYTCTLRVVVDRIGTRDMRAHAATLIRRAAGGERIVITVGGRTMAQLGPLESTPGDETIDDLAARGLIDLAHRSDRPAPSERIDLRTGTRLDRLLREVRGS